MARQEDLNNLAIFTEPDFMQQVLKLDVRDSFRHWVGGCPWHPLLSQRARLLNFYPEACYQYKIFILTVVESFAASA